MSREAFEAWIKRDSTLSVERDGEGYRDMDVYLMWRVWPVAQADAFERAAKVCECERLGDDVDCDEDRAYNDAIRHAADAIRALAKEATR